MKKRHSKKALDKLLDKAGKEMAEDASRLAQINDDGSINRLAEVLARRTNAFGQTEMIIRMDASIPEYLFDRLVDANGDLFGEFRLFDNRVITAQQRKFINALLQNHKKRQQGQRHRHNYAGAYAVSIARQGAVPVSQAAEQTGILPHRVDRGRNALQLAAYCIFKNSAALLYPTVSVPK